MIKVLLCIVFAASLFVGVCKVQSTEPSKDMGWGEDICGAQLLISLSTNAMAADSTISVQNRIKNSSTNYIEFSFAPVAYLLTNSFGKTYELRSARTRFDNMNLVGKPGILPGDITSWLESVTVGKDVEPGDYVLGPITRNITTVSNKVCTLVSNSLKIKVVK